MHAASPRTSPELRARLGPWIPVLLWAATIFVFSTSLFSGEATGHWIVPILRWLFPQATPRQLIALHRAVRKAGHFVEYLVLSVLLYRALRAGRHTRLAAAGMAILISGLYSVTDELHQLIVPGRTAAASDCVIDVSGAAVGQGLLAAIARPDRTVVRNPTAL